MNHGTGYPIGKRVEGPLTSGRKALPHSMERQRGLKIRHSTTPEQRRLYKGNLLCLAG